MSKDGAPTGQIKVTGSAAVTGVPPRTRLPYRVALLVVVCLVFVGTVAGGMVYLWHNTHTTKKDIATKTATTQTSKEQVFQSADSTAYGGDYGAAKKILDEAIAQAKTPEEKVYYQSKAVSVALNAGNKADAYIYAKAAYVTAPSASTAFEVGQQARANGDNATAKTYIQKAIDTLDKSNPGADIILAGYQAALTEVSK